MNRTLTLLALGFTLASCSIDGTPGGRTRQPYVPPSGPTPYTPPPPTPQPRKLVLLHTNDEHSHLLGDNPNTEYPFMTQADGGVSVATVATKLAADHTTVGGFSRRQFLINKLRSTLTDPVLVVSAGDETMGSLFHLAGNKLAPDYVSMALAGYDVMTLGNHEFDFGPDYLAQMIDTAGKVTFGGAVPIVATNIHFDDVTASGPGAALKAMYGAGDSGAPVVPWLTRTTSNGLKVGFVGALGWDAALVAPSKSPIVFSVPQGPACSSTSPCDGGTCELSRCVNPLDAAGHIAAAVADIQPVVTMLRTTEKVDLVVLLSHMGQAEDRAFAAQIDGLDVIIGGHSHEEVAPVTTPWKSGGGNSIMVQAGSYGRKLGKLTLVVGTDGKVSLDAANTELLPVDSAIDPEIFGATNLTATPPVIAPTFTTALSYTQSIIGGVATGLDALLGPALGLPNNDLFAPIVSSDHDVIGEIPNQDSNLSHMVTDAEARLIIGGSCTNPVPAAGGNRVVAVQANGVLRDSLKFGALGHASTADIFRVLPLGISPWPDPSVNAPGYPITMFRLTPIELFAGIEVGLTKGSVSDSFFLSYAGMKVTWDSTLTDFSTSTAALTGTGPNGHITKIEMAVPTDVANPAKLPEQWTYETVYQYDPATPTPWLGRWTAGVDPINSRIIVISNLYLTGFLSAFGLAPRGANDATLALYETVVCQTMDPNASATCAAGGACTVDGDCAANQRCATGPGVCVPRTGLAMCAQLPDSTVPPAGAPKWMRPEAKEWEVLFSYLVGPQAKGGLGGTLPTGLYSGATPALPRVIKTQ